MSFVPQWSECFTEHLIFVYKQGQLTMLGHKELPCYSYKITDIKKLFCDLVARSLVFSYTKRLVSRDECLTCIEITESFYEAYLYITCMISDCRKAKSSHCTKTHHTSCGAIGVFCSFIHEYFSIAGSITPDFYQCCDIMSFVILVCIWNDSCFFELSEALETCFVFVESHGIW